ncbi:MAG: hypothetical protein G01um101418_947 [Parcubacteria group bacterium Gr01-1014_18]|nr:MAG: hypothetical protein Greene041636_949 [Parcubacteria group bacterium Greene0416_36]TSC79686.1 MAG: hypothetical protein G01um101418_947 [Parcubacteria group bacterium Gr01-1014_18]TSC97866.1 MAG: hypothetical protein Greene101420_971 [Parcubacteria group bacterium Greene1014_20]TSD06490.1 MAG: hypothetical protein Greene07142_871 [Parcubacteria group bacterium Greene0714_2]
MKRKKRCFSWTLSCIHGEMTETITLTFLGCLEWRMNDRLAFRPIAIGDTLWPKDQVSVARFDCEISEVDYFRQQIGYFLAGRARSGFQIQDFSDLVAYAQAVFDECQNSYSTFCIDEVVQRYSLRTVDWETKKAVSNRKCSKSISLAECLKKIDSELEQRKAHAQKMRDTCLKDMLIVSHIVFEDSGTRLSLKLSDGREKNLDLYLEDSLSVERFEFVRSELRKQGFRVSSLSIGELQKICV